MDKTQRILKQLLAAKDALERAIESLSEKTESAELVKTCPVCGDPIYSDQPTQRGVHKKCVPLAANRVKDGIWTQGMMDAALEPRQSGGRKKKKTPLDATLADSLGGGVSGSQADALRRASAGKRPDKKNGPKSPATGSPDPS